MANESANSTAPNESPNENCVTLEAVEQSLSQIDGMAELIEAEYAALRALKLKKSRRPSETAEKYVSLEAVEQALGQIPGMTELIETEYTALRSENAALHAGEFVKQLRTRAHLSQAALAGKLRVSPTRISEVEKGVGPLGPSVTLLARIAEACGGLLQLSIKPRDSHNPACAALI